MLINKLYKVDDNIVFYSPNLTAVRDSYYDGIISGEMIAYDVYGNVMDKYEAGAAFMKIRDYMQNPLSLSDQIYRNMKVADFLIATVKEELISESTPLEYMSKLDTVISLIQTGSLDTAATQLLSMIPDDIITDEQITRWASYCTSADAIEVEE